MPWVDGVAHLQIPPVLRLYRMCFRLLLTLPLLYVSVTRPATDLCWDCRKNMNFIIHSSNLSEEEKSEQLLKAQEHLESARSEQ